MLIKPVEKIIWKEDLKQYESTKKKNLPRLPMNKKRTHNLEKQNEYQFNTILNQYRDQAKDLNDLKKVVKLKKKKRSIENFNLLTMKGDR